MSARLMGMKFMQRAAANEALQTPDSGSEKRPRKRQKRANGFAAAPLITPNAAAPTSEGKTKHDLVRRQAEAAGDTQWTLVGHDAQPKPRSEGGYKITDAGFATIDAYSEESSRDRREGGVAVENLDGTTMHLRLEMSGRKSFGKFGNAMEVCRFPVL